MKPSNLALPFLLLALTTNLQSSISSEDPEVVQYKDGGNITQMAPIYILPAKNGHKGGGLTLAKTKNQTCPLSVIQDNCDSINGLPIQIFVQENRDQFVLTGSQLDIAFVDMPVNCALTLVWTMIDDFPHDPYVAIGAAMDHQGESIVNGAFSFHRYKEAYKLMFCPLHNTPSPYPCMNIGIHEDKFGNRRLILTDKDPFQVVLMRGDD